MASKSYKILPKHVYNGAEFICTYSRIRGFKVGSVYVSTLLTLSRRPMEEKRYIIASEADGWVEGSIELICEYNHGPPHSYIGVQFIPMVLAPEEEVFAYKLSGKMDTSWIEGLG